MENINTKALRLMIMEAIEQMRRCSECGAMYEVGEGHACSMDEAHDDELDEFSGAGAVAGYSLPLGMRPSGPRRASIVKTAHRSFGGMPKPLRKR